MNSLVTALQALGFISVLGTEASGFHGEVSHVSRGEPNKHDQNNGVVVVYDESGAPWVARGTDLNDGELAELVRDFRLKSGAQVPHANDGGYFLRTGSIRGATGAA